MIMVDKLLIFILFHHSSKLTNSKRFIDNTFQIEKYHYFFNNYFLNLLYYTLLTIYIVDIIVHLSII